MFWADELAASVERAAGRQRLQDAVGHRPRRAACAASCCTTPSAAPLPSAGLDVTFRYGVEDLDPMDAQSLLTPDAVEPTWACRWRTCRRRRAATRPNYARHFAGLFLETFAGLGIRPSSTG